MSNSKTKNENGLALSKDPIADTLEAAQIWVKEHKVVTALAAAAVLYFLGGRRVRGLIGMALKSGATAGLANAALSTVLPSATPAQKSERVDDSMYH